MKPFTIFLIIIISLIVFIGLVLLFLELVVNKMFHRRFDGDIRFKFLSINDYPNLIKKNVSIKSSLKDKLNGGIFFYKDKKYKGVIIFYHGLYSGYINYLNLIEYFCQKDFIVVAFDSYATMSSEGKSLKGIGQADKDVKEIINFFINNKELNIYPIFTLGHSMGAHQAITSIIIDDIHIKKAVALSPFNSNVDVNYSYDKRLILLTPFIYLFNVLKFGFRNYYKVTDAINYSAADMLILYGSDDPLLKKKYSYDKYLSSKKTSNADNVELKLINNRKHFLYLSKEAEEYYTNNISWPRKKPIDFDNLDYSLINKLDYKLLDEIIDYFLN